MIDRKDLYVGKQIVFDDGNREPEHGIVSSWNSKSVFCRFFRDDMPTFTLRTVANSEACAYADLKANEFLSKEDVDYILDTFRQSPEKYGWIEQEQEVKEQNEN